MVRAFAKGECSCSLATGQLRVLALLAVISCIMCSENGYRYPRKIPLKSHVQLWKLVNNLEDQPVLNCPAFLQHLLKLGVADHQPQVPPQPSHGQQLHPTLSRLKNFLGRTLTPGCRQPCSVQVDQQGCDATEGYTRPCPTDLGALAQDC